MKNVCVELRKARMACIQLAAKLSTEKFSKHLKLFLSPPKPSPLSDSCYTLYLGIILSANPPHPRSKKLPSPVIPAPKYFTNLS